MTRADSQPEWEAEIRLSPADVTQIVAATYTEFLGSPVVLYAEGWDNVAFLVDDRVLFRFPRRSIAVGLLEREIELLPQIAGDLPLPISAPTYHGTWRGDLGWPFAGYQLLTGNPASLENLDEARRSQLVEPLATFLKHLHAIPAKALLEAGLVPDPFARFDATRWTPKALKRAALAKQHGFDVPSAVLDWFEGAQPRVGTYSTLVHGDLYARHILLDGTGVPCGIIDWGDIHLGSPAIDLAVAHTMLPPSFHDTFKYHYGPIEAGVWEAARWRGIYSALLCLHYGIEADSPDMRACGSAALALIAKSKDF